MLPRIFVVGLIVVGVAGYVVWERYAPATESEPLPVVDSSVGGLP